MISGCLKSDNYSGVWFDSACSSGNDWYFTYAGFDEPENADIWLISTESGGYYLDANEDEPYPKYRIEESLAQQWRTIAA